MAMRITAKDRVFVMVVLPLAALAGYWYFVRSSPVAKKYQSLEARKAALGEAEDIDFQKMALQRRVKECEARYLEILAQPAETNATLTAEVDFSGRLKGVLGTFERAGVRVVKSEPVKADGATSGKGVALATLQNALSQIAVQRWSFELEATYGDVVRALSDFAADDSAVVCESLRMKPAANARTCKWTVTLCL